MRASSPHFLFSNETDKNSHLTIQVASADHQSDIARVDQQAYEETYSAQYDPRKRDALFKDFNEDHCKFFIAKWDSKVIGYAKIILIEEKGHAKSATLDKLYLLKAYHHRGGGSALMRRCLGEASRYKVSTIHLLVWEKNKNAIQFYEKFNFVKGDKVPFYSPGGQIVDGVYNYAMCRHNLSCDLHAKVSCH